MRWDAADVGWKCDGTHHDVLQKCKTTEQCRVYTFTGFGDHICRQAHLFTNMVDEVLVQVSGDND